MTVALGAAMERGCCLVGVQRLAWATAPPPKVRLGRSVSAAAAAAAIMTMTIIMMPTMEIMRKACGCLFLLLAPPASHQSRCRRENDAADADADDSAAPTKWPKLRYTAGSKQRRELRAKAAEMAAENKLRVMQASERPSRRQRETR